jgi:hypothetical protein
MPIHRTVLIEYRTAHSRVVRAQCGHGVLSALEASSARTGFSIAPQALEGLPGVRHVQPNHSEVGVPLASRTIRPPSPLRLCLVSRACTHP